MDFFRRKKKERAEEKGLLDDDQQERDAAAEPATTAELELQKNILGFFNKENLQKLFLSFNFRQDVHLQLLSAKRIDPIYMQFLMNDGGDLAGVSFKDSKGDIIRYDIESRKLKYASDIKSTVAEVIKFYQNQKPVELKDVIVPKSIIKLRFLSQLPKTVVALDGKAEGKSTEYEVKVGDGSVEYDVRFERCKKEGAKEEKEAINISFGEDDAVEFRDDEGALLIGDKETQAREFVRECRSAIEADFNTNVKNAQATALIKQKLLSQKETFNGGSVEANFEIKGDKDKKDGKNTYFRIEISKESQDHEKLSITEIKYNDVYPSTRVVAYGSGGFFRVMGILEENIRAAEVGSNQQSPSQATQASSFAAVQNQEVDLDFIANGAFDVFSKINESVGEYSFSKTQNPAGILLQSKSNKIEIYKDDAGFECIAFTEGEGVETALIFGGDEELTCAQFDKNGEQRDVDPALFIRKIAKELNCEKAIATVFADEKRQSCDQSHA